ncbi:NAD-dependent epimerase/dehydratase family protein [Candidatus Woesearchaeota archaeon]|nr:NAD-dependent epimerase/dehydratase family protein [Candidatus Woesearchaeota archaeon]
MGKIQGKIVVTGGSGFIGANLVRKLYDGKNEITVFARDINHPFLSGLKIKKIKGDIRNYKSVLNAVRGSDYLFHLAACTLSSPKRKNEIFSTNILGTENVMKACLKSDVKKVVNVSSSSVFGFAKSGKIKLNENYNLDFKDNLYAQSKKLAEDKVKYYVGRGLKAVIANPSYVIGAGEVDKRRFGLYQSIYQGRIKFVYPGGGGNVAVEDIVDGLILVMEKGVVGERYILSTNNARIYDFYNLIAKLLKKPKIRFMLPRVSYYPMYLLGAFFQNLIDEPPLTTESVRWHFNYKYFDNSKARRLGWKPKIPLNESVKRAIKYYRSIGVLGD